MNPGGRAVSAGFAKASTAIALLAIVFLAAPQARSQESVTEVPFCDLAKNPKDFDGKKIRVRGTFSVHFEDFTLFSKDCKSADGPWLAFGGDVPGIVTSMVNDNGRQSGVDLNFRGVSYGIKKDENFRRLYALIAALRGNEPEYSVTATLTGTFFAKEKATADGFVGGYGHLNCCSLFIITEVADVVSDPPANLNLRGTVSDEHGRPMLGLVVFDDVEGGSPPERQFATTDQEGHFQFSNSGQLLRLEDPRYRPLAVSVEPGGAPVHLKVEDAKRSDWTLPACTPVTGSARRVGFSLLLTLPSGFESKPFNGDENMPSYFVFHRGGSEHDPDLIISTEPTAKEQPFELGGSGGAEQRWVKDREGKTIGIDSVNREGRYFHRVLALMTHDFAAYQVRSRSRARQLNQIIDSACLSK